MIPILQAILEDLVAGKITIAEAMKQIEEHQDNLALQSLDRRWVAVSESIPITDYETDEWACAAGIERFSAAMRSKLDAKRKAGRGGWNKPDECEIEFLRGLLGDHIKKGDVLDIANFCMMIWNRENPTAPLPAPPAEQDATPQASEQSTKGEGEAALPSPTPASAAPDEQDTERKLGHSALRVREGKIERFDPHPKSAAPDTGLVEKEFYAFLDREYPTWRGYKRTIQHTGMQTAFEEGWKAAALRGRKG